MYTKKEKKRENKSSKVTNSVQANPITRRITIKSYRITKYNGKKKPKKKKTGV